VTGASIVRLDNISVVRGGRVALDGISLDLQSGEILTLLGPNGSGKSTLLHVLGLLRRPESGAIYFHGQPMPWGSGLLPLRRRMATVFQQPLLLDTSVRENVALGLKLRGVPDGEVRKRVTRWLERMGVGNLGQRSARQLSGGEAQRVSMARALVLEPEVLLLDEPLKELDTPTRDALIQELKSILAETHTTTVFVTHDRSEALTLSDRVAILMSGRLMQIGATDEVFNRPSSQEVANFVGVDVVIPGRIIACDDGVASVEIAGGIALSVATELNIGARVFVCLRPEDVTLFPESPEPATSSARNRFSGTIVRVQQIGSLYKAVVDCGFELPALVTKQSVVDLGLEAGRQVGASFKATAAHIIARTQ
jgi:molybdopterin-binding protein